jgi:hypothetical protein
LRVSRSWVYEAAKEGRIPSVRLGGPDGPLRFLVHDVDSWLDRARSAWVPGESTTAATRRAARPASTNPVQLSIDTIIGGQGAHQ